jgi:glutaredoxin
VAEDTTARDELIAKTGRMAVPVITVDDEVVVGFDRGRLQRLLGISQWLQFSALTAAH